MYLRILKIILAGSLVTYIPGFAQQLDSIQKLNEVTVTGSRFRYFNTGHFNTVIDSATLTTLAASNIGEILTTSSMYQINNYGTGSASVSARGMGEKRTPVIWNGFNIQNILSTGVDLCQLPCSFFEDINAQSGGSSALYGSGAAGGVLFLSNKQKFNQGIKGNYNSHLGSFAKFYSGGELSYSNENYAGSVKAYFNKAKNNFPYSLTYGGIDIDTVQPNAQARQYGIMVNNTYRFSSDNYISINLFYTNSRNNIAPTLNDIAFNSVADGLQHDKFFAATSEFNTTLGKVNLFARSGFFNTNLYYEKPSWAQISDSKALWWVNEAEATISVMNYFKINCGFNFTYERGKSSSFITKNSRYRESVFSSVKFNHPGIHLSVSANGRGEIVAEELIPLTYSFGIEYKPTDILTLKGNIAKNYRLPSFNDLYYKDPWSEGNPYLSAEEGINYELGIEYKEKTDISTFTFGANWFLSKMDNWINWAMRQDSIWSVFNIDKADITGMETFFQAGLVRDNSELSGKIMYSFTDAKDRNSGNYIAYVPQNKITVTINAKIYNTSLLYQLVNVGERYTDGLNTDVAKAYNISNIILSNTTKYFGSFISFDIGIYNLFNKDYMILNGYPMPKRNYRAGIRILF